MVPMILFCYFEVQISKNNTLESETIFEFKNYHSQVKFGGGFYAGKIEVEGKAPIYVFNGFFMEMRSKFVTPGESV